MPLATREEAAARYAELPVPDRTQEAWRFTSLKGFDPDSYGSNGHVQGSDSGTMLEIDVAGLAVVSEGGISIEKAPEGITFEPLTDDALLGTLVGADDK